MHTCIKQRYNKQFFWNTPREVLQDFLRKKCLKKSSGERLGFIEFEFQDSKLTKTEDFHERMAADVITLKGGK